MAQSVPNTPAAEHSDFEPQEHAYLDARLASVLDAIEKERSPARLLELAVELQSELASRRQRRQPN